MLLDASLFRQHPSFNPSCSSLKAEHVNSGQREALSLLGAGLGLKATSELLEFGLVVLSDEVQFAVA